MKLESGEEIKKIIRKHPFYIILEVFGLIILAILPALLPHAIGYINTLIAGIASSVRFDLMAFIPLQLQAFLYNLWLLTLWLIFVYRFTDYYLDKWVLTNRRIIDVEQRGFFIREVSSVRYPMIQDVTINVSGLFPTLLNFGTIQVQTAGVEQEFLLTLAPDPLINKEFIIELKRDHVA